MCPVALYGRETLSLKLRKERKLRVFENKMLMRIFWPKRDYKIGDGSKSHNEKLHNLYISINHSFINGSTALCWALPLLQFRILCYKDGRTPWTSDQPVARPLPKHRTTQTQNKRIHRHPCIEWVWIHNPSVGANEDHALDRAATVIGNLYISRNIIRMSRSRRRGRAGHVAHIEREDMHVGF
jgi:hypothetical protein